MPDETAPTRVEIAEALFARLNTAANFLTRQNGRLPTPSEVPGVQQPALYLGMPDETVTYVGRGLRRSTLTYMAAVFGKGGGANGDSAGLAIADLIDRIEAVLQPRPAEDGDDPHCTLNGLVAWARIEGDIVSNEYSTGESQGLAFIPITVLTP